MFKSFLFFIDKGVLWVFGSICATALVLILVAQLFPEPRDKDNDRKD